MSLELKHSLGVIEVTPHGMTKKYAKEHGIPQDRIHVEVTFDDEAAVLRTALKAMQTVFIHNLYKSHHEKSADPWKNGDHLKINQDGHRHLTAKERYDRMNPQEREALREIFLEEERKKDKK